SFSLVTRRLPSSTLFPYTTLFRSLRFCTGCNACLRQTTCAITDDDNAYLHAKMLEADGIILGSPCYFGNVTALMKNFMDRTRCLHMVQPALKGKVGGAVTHAGLRHG